MTHREFLTLTEDEQFCFAKYNGVRVATCIQGLYKYVLFQIGLFYLEGKVDRNADKTVEIFSFAGTDGLDKYLTLLSLPPELYQP